MSSESPFAAMPVPLDRVITPVGLSRLEEILSSLIRHTDFGFWMFEMDSENHLVSEQWCRQLGYQPGELRGSFQDWRSLIHPDDFKRVEENYRRYLASRNDRYTQEFRLRHKDGRYSWFRTDGGTLRDSTGRPIAVFGWHIDIDSQHASDSRIESLNRDLNAALELAALGELVGGLVHELASPITVLQVRLAMAEQKLHQTQLAEDDPVARLVSELRPAVEQIVQVHSGLRALMQNGRVEEAVELDVFSVIDKAIEFVKSRLERNRIQLCVRDMLVADGVCSVEGNHTQLMEIVINLLNNSIDAIVEKRLEHERREIQVRVRDVRPHVVAIEVADSGDGIAESVRDRLMSPLATTKQESGGMGLGLSISKRIAEAHRGALRLEAAHDAELGGALFQFSLPTYQSILADTLSN